MISADLLLPMSLLLAWLLYVPVVLLALWRVPWVELCTDFRRQHLLFGSALILLLLWLVRRDFDSGLSFHFIGLTAATLLLGWPQAVLAALLGQLGLLALGRIEFAAMAANGLLFVLVPIFITELAARWVERRQPRNLFVYIFLSGFFPAAFTALLSLLLSVAWLWHDGLFLMPPWLEDFVGYLWLVMFPEAFINGMLITGLVVFHPEWLETFNRTRYLQAPWRDAANEKPD